MPKLLVGVRCEKETCGSCHGVRREGAEVLWCGIFDQMLDAWHGAPKRLDECRAAEEADSEDL